MTKTAETTASQEVRNLPEYRAAFIDFIQKDKQPTDEEKRNYALHGGARIPGTAETKFSAIGRQAAPVLDLMKLYEIPGDVTIFASQTNNAAVVNDENTAISPDDFFPVALTGYNIIKVIGASQTVATLSAGAFEDYTAEELAPDIYRRMEDLVFNGTGVDEPAGLVVAGSGADGAYVEDTDQLTVAAPPMDNDFKTFVKMVTVPGAAIFCNKNTFLDYVEGLTSVQGAPIVTKEAGQYYLYDMPVYFSSTIADDLIYCAALEHLIGNVAEPVYLQRSRIFLQNMLLFKATATFDCAPVTGRGAFARMVIDIP